MSSWRLCLRVEPGLPKKFVTKAVPGSKRVAGTEIEIGAIFGGDSLTEKARRAKIENGKTVEGARSVPEANDLIQKRSYLAVYGIVTYYDVFGVRHWTRFCRDGFFDGQKRK